ncbi:MAG: hypothetical protein ACFB0B_22415 [Thermonemataceae bacterium]
MITKKLLIVLFFYFTVPVLLLAQTQEKQKERAYICHNKNGTSEVVYFVGNTSVAMHVYYMSSKNPTRVKLNVLGYDARTRTYTVSFPNALKDETYKFSLMSNANMQCRNPDGTLQTFVLSDGKPLEYVSKNKDGSSERLLLLTSDTQHHIEGIFYSSSTSKSKMQVAIVSKNDRLKKYKVRFPNKAQLYTLDWQRDKEVGMNQVLLVHPDGIAQVFLAR